LHKILEMKEVKEKDYGNVTLTGTKDCSLNSNIKNNNFCKIL